MEEVIRFISIWCLFMLTVVSPGPDLLIVTKASLSFGRKAGVMCALGIAAGLIFHSLYCVFGVAVLIKETPSLFLALKLLGVCYLIFLGVNALRYHQIANAAQQEKNETTHSKHIYWKNFITGFLTNLLNVKAMFWLLMFYTTIIPDTFNLVWRSAFAVSALSGALIFFTFIALVIAHPFIVQQIQKAGKWIDRLIGVLFIGLALEIIIKEILSYLSK